MGIKKTSSRKSIISNLNSFNKKKLLVFIPAIKKLKLKVKNANIAMIDINIYYIAYHFKEIQVFIILIRNI